MQLKLVEIESSGRSRCFFIALVLMCLASELHAAEMQVGDADLVAGVRIDYTSTSNAFRSTSSPLESNGVIVSPVATIAARRRGLSAEFGYSGAFGAFSFDDLNYDDHELILSSEAVLGVRKRAKANAFLKKGHFSLGENATRGVAGVGDEQIEYVTAGVDGSFTFGADTARLNATGGLIVEAFDYQNRSDIVGGRDFSEITPYGEISYRLSLDTRVTSEIRLRSVSSEIGLFDRNELQGLIGLRFRGTGKSGGSLKLGMSNVNYDNNGLADQTLLTAKAQLYVTPTSYSRIELNLSRALSDTEGLGSDIGAKQSIDELASLRWIHQWSGFVSSDARLEVNKNNRECPDVGTTSTNAQINLVYGVLNWVDVGVGFSDTDRSGNYCDGEEIELALDYEKQDVYIFVNLLL